MAIIETIYALAEYYKVPRKQIATAPKKFYTHRKIQFNYNIFEQTMGIYTKHISLSIEVCHLATVAYQDKHLPFWTCDEKLAKQTNNLPKELPLQQI